MYHPSQRLGSRRAKVCPDGFKLSDIAWISLTVATGLLRLAAVSAARDRSEAHAGAADGTADAEFTAPTALVLCQRVSDDNP